MEKTYNVSEAASVIGVSVKTLQRWDREGKLVANRTPSNRRFYTEKQIHDIYNDKEVEKMIKKRATFYRHISRYIACKFVCMTAELSEENPVDSNLFQYYLYPSKIHLGNLPLGIFPSLTSLWLFCNYYQPSKRLHHMTHRLSTLSHTLLILIIESYLKS